jgi:hypothetical protein
MTADQYVASVIQKYAVNAASASPASKAANQLIPILKAWAGQSLLGIQFSGSYAKGTAISLGTDVDLFISLDSTQPVKEIYWSLFNYVAAQQLRPQAQNVSIRIQSSGLNVDCSGTKAAGQHRRPLSLQAQEKLLGADQRSATHKSGLKFRKDRRNPRH